MIAPALLLPALAIVCIAAAGSPASGAAPGAARKPATHTVTIDAARFTPAEIEVKSGDTIVWVNKDILAHTATSPAGGFDSGVIQPGKSWKLVVRKAGQFAYTCSFHPMNGKVTVR